jgi:hypothetical protein
MQKRLVDKPWLMLSAGLAMGLLVGTGMMVGVLVATYHRAGKIAFPETILNATATHGGRTMAMATGPIDGGVEGLFVLDFITGELQCSVLHPRSGQVGGLYRHNVVQDLGVEIGKQPSYLMVTGIANFRTAGGNLRPAETVVYVADENTGNFAAYMLPWNRGAAQYNFAQVNPMVIIGRGTARSIVVE